MNVKYAVNVCAESDHFTWTLQWSCVVGQKTGIAEFDWFAGQLSTEHCHSEVCNLQSFKYKFHL